MSCSAGRASASGPWPPKLNARFSHQSETTRCRVTFGDALDRGDQLRLQPVGEVDLAVAQRLDHGFLVRVDAELDAIDLGLVAPEVLVALDREALAGLPIGERERAAADRRARAPPPRMSRRVCPSYSRPDLLGHDVDPRRHVGREGRLLRRPDQGLVVGRLERGVEREVALVLRDLVVDHEPVAERDVARGERRAVAPLQAVAQACRSTPWSPRSARTRWPGSGRDSGPRRRTSASCRTASWRASSRCRRSPPRCCRW